MAQPTPGISVRRDGENVAIEDYDVEFGKPVLTRISLVDAATAIRIGRALVRLGEEIIAEVSTRHLAAFLPPNPKIAQPKTLELGPRTDPYPEDRK